MLPNLYSLELYLVTLGLNAFWNVENSFAIFWFLWLLNGRTFRPLISSTIIILCKCSSQRMNIQFFWFKFNFEFITSNIHSFWHIGLQVLTNAESHVPTWQGSVFLLPLARKVGLSFRYPIVHISVQLGLPLGKLLRYKGEKIKGLPAPTPSLVGYRNIFFFLNSSGQRPFSLKILEGCTSVEATTWCHREVLLGVRLREN